MLTSDFIQKMNLLTLKSHSRCMIVFYVKQHLKQLFQLWVQRHQVKSTYVCWAVTKDGQVLLPLAVVFWGIQSHGRCKKQLWLNTISNSLCVFGHTIDESYSKELKRPEKHSNGRKCCHDITLALINGVSLCLYLNNLCEQRRAPQLGLFPW